MAVRDGRPQVGILMGSDSDWDTMEGAAERLASFEIPYEVQVVSAHRSPKAVMQYAQTARRRGLAVIIAGAGGAAHLGGVVAAYTTLPVIGVPVASTPLQGFDALLATVQMPGGVPVATVAIGRAGAENAAVLAAQILALRSRPLRERLERFKTELAESVEGKNLRLRATTEAAVAALAAGELVVFPTETVYGLGADALSEDAVARLVAVRGREPEKPILVLVAGLAMAETVAAEIPPPARRLAERFWPGPLTLVLAARDRLPAALTAGSGTIGVRVPGHPVAAALVTGLGRPVTAPSANPPRGTPPRRVEEARATFGAGVAVYLDGGELPGGASTVAMLEEGRVRVLRTGPVSEQALRRALEGD